MLLIILGIIGIIWFLIPFFTWNILNIGNLTGLCVSAALLLCGIFGRPLKIAVGSLWQRASGKAAVTILALFLCAVVVLVAAETVCMIRSATKKPKSEDATMIILGCKVTNGSPSMMLKERLDAAYDYLTAHPDTNCILSGGQGDDESISEAACMYQYLTAHGIDSSRLYIEDASSSTRENLAFSKKIIEENDLPPKVLLVTNEFHEYRAGKVAEALGMDYAAVPASTNPLLFATFYVRELYGILYQWFL